MELYKKGVVLKHLLNPFDKNSLVSLSKISISQNDNISDIREKSLINLNLDQITASKLIIQTLKIKFPVLFYWKGLQAQERLKHTSKQ